MIPLDEDAENRRWIGVLMLFRSAEMGKKMDNFFFFLGYNFAWK